MYWNISVQKYTNCFRIFNLHFDIKFLSILLKNMRYVLKYRFIKIFIKVPNSKINYVSLFWYDNISPVINQIEIFIILVDTMFYSSKP